MRRSPIRISSFVLLLAALVALISCDQAEAPQEEAQAELVLEDIGFEDLPGWGQDDFTAFAPAYQKSCARILRADGAKEFGALKMAGLNANWVSACAALQEIDQADNAAVQRWLEAYFRPFSVGAGADKDGLFTGYYEASLRGSRTQSDTYHTPLYKRPDDLVMVNLGEFREHLKGERIAGRVSGGQLKPYETRKEIVEGRWPHKEEVLVWVDDPVDAFFVQIQGSGVVALEDGDEMRIGYAGQNGHVYTAIGKALIERGEVSREDMSMQAIRSWLAANPHEADALMNINESYVFFQELSGDGPLGGEGVALTPGRSLAIDRSLLAYGMPVWVDIEAPPGFEGAERLQRLMVAQDTGGAIRGAVRGDVFWGYGERAEALAGGMKSSGRYWVLLPR